MNDKKQFHIKNTAIEEMFMAVADDMAKYKFFKHVESGSIALATAYASKIVKDRFFTMLNAGKEELVYVESQVVNYL